MNNLKKNSRYFSLHGHKERDPTLNFLETNVRSYLDCAARCTEAYYCQGANFQANSDGSGLCRLYTEYAKASELSNNPEWKYFETVNEP